MDNVVTRDSGFLRKRDGTFIYVSYDRLVGDSYKSRRAWILCAPWGEEKKNSERMMVELARALALQGDLAVRFDYSGQGDSTGIEGSYGFDDWVDDIACVVERVRSCGKLLSVGLIGARLGAYLAARASRAVNPDTIAMWQPVLSPRTHFLSIIRQKFVVDLVTRRNWSDMKSMHAEACAKHGDMNILGHSVGSRLAQSFRAAENLAVEDLMCPHVLLVEVGWKPSEKSSLRRFSLRLYDIHKDSLYLFVQARPFWEFNRGGVCTELIRATSSWIERLPSASVPESRSSPDARVYELDTTNRALLRSGVTESAVSLCSSGETICGILSVPVAAPKSRWGILMVNGMAGYRIGSHRMLVKGARHFAKVGYNCLRLDFRGRGESGTRTRDIGDEGRLTDLAVAVRYLHDAHDIVNVVVCASCNACRAAMRLPALTELVKGVVFWGPISVVAIGDQRKRVGSQWRVDREHLTRMLGKLLMPETWKKMWSRSISLKAAIPMSYRSRASITGRNADQRCRHVFLDVASCRCRGPLPLLAISGSRDRFRAAAQESLEVVERECGVRLTYDVIPHANHTFDDAEWETTVFTMTSAWLNRECCQA